MQYFFIFGNVASIAALIGFIMQASEASDSSGRHLSLRHSRRAAVAVLFWVYFISSTTRFRQQSKVA